MQNKKIVIDYVPLAAKYPLPPKVEEFEKRISCVI